MTRTFCRSFPYVSICVGFESGSDTVSLKIYYTFQTRQMTSKAVLFNWQLAACFEISSNLNSRGSCPSSSKAIRAQNHREICFNQEAKLPPLWTLNQNKAISWFNSYSAVRWWPVCAKTRSTPIPVWIFHQDKLNDEINHDRLHTIWLWWCFWSKHRCHLCL